MTASGAETASAARRPVVTARACRTRAVGTDSTSPPAAFARQPKSRSSRSSGKSGSKPPRSSQASRRTREPALGTASTSAGSSPVAATCWRCPDASVDRPASTISRGSAQSSPSEPSTVADGVFVATRRSSSRQSGSGAQSSCSSHSHAPGSPQRPTACSTASATAAAKPVSLESVMTPESTGAESGPKPSGSAASASSRGVASVDPVSTASTCRGRTVLRRNEESASGSQFSPL